MIKEEVAKQFANDIDEFKVAGVLLAAGDVKHVYRIGRYEGFLAGFEAEKSQWHYVKDKDFPTEEGCYLVCRKHNGQRYLELLGFDGKYWVTGLHDDPEDFIIAWKSEDLPEEE